jgi:hypothetical protein
MVVLLDIVVAILALLLGLRMVRTGPAPWPVVPRTFWSVGGLADRTGANGATRAPGA